MAVAKSKPSAKAQEPAFPSHPVPDFTKEQDLDAYRRMLSTRRLASSA